MTSSFRAGARKVAPSISPGALRFRRDKSAARATKPQPARRQGIFLFSRCGFSPTGALRFCDDTPPTRAQMRHEHEAAELRLPRRKATQARSGSHVGTGARER